MKRGLRSQGCAKRGDHPFLPPIHPIAWKGPYSITYAQRNANHRSARVPGSEMVRRMPKEVGETYPKSRPLRKSELSDAVEHGPCRATPKP
jgi:hypothetical protein